MNNKGRYFAVVFAFVMRFYETHRADLAAELPSNVIAALDVVAGMVNTIKAINPPGPL
jgi:hypothetical protein